MVLDHRGRLPRPGEPAHERIAQNIRDLADARGVKLAHLSDVGRSTLVKMLACEQSLTVEWLAEALDVDVATWSGRATLPCDGLSSAVAAREASAANCGKFLTGWPESPNIEVFGSRMHCQTGTAPLVAMRQPPSPDATLDDVDDALLEELERRTAIAGYWDFLGTRPEPQAHGLFQYPAMMVAPMQGELLNILSLLQPTARSLLDPFAGSGTVLVEGMLRGYSVTAQDVNPLSLLLCTVKAGPFDVEALRAAGRRVVDSMNSSQDMSFARRFHNQSKWFTRAASIALSRIVRGIEDEADRAVRRFLWVAMAETIRLRSNSRTSTYKLHVRSEVPVHSVQEILGVFEGVLARNIGRFSKYASVLQQNGLVDDAEYASGVLVRHADARASMTERFDVVVTSPPYGDNTTTVPYGQSAYLPLLWIAREDLPVDDAWDYLASTHEIDARSLGGASRKREADASKSEQVLRESPSLQQTVAALRLQPRDRVTRVTRFAFDIRETIRVLASSTRCNGYQMWTVGNRRVGGVEVRLDQILVELAEHAGLRHVVSISRRISGKRMARRNSVSDTMREERLLVLRKVV